jgi:hypothetical protein
MESALGKNTADCDLIILHASLGHSFEELMEQAMEMAPRAQVVAASCCGIVGKEGVSESMKDIALMAVKGKETAMAWTNDIYGKNSYEKSREMAIDLKEKLPGTNMIYFMASGIDIANDLCIEGIESVFGKDITIFGATSSDNMKGIISYQGINGKVHEHAAFIVGFGDPTLEVNTQATHGFLAIGEPLIVTKSEGHYIHELNGKPAWTEFTHRLGLESTATCGDSIPIGALAEKLPPELAKEYGNDHILRVVTRHEGETLLYATTCAKGTKLWLTVRDEPLIFNEMDRMVQEMQQKMGGRKPVAVFHADCLARGRFLFNRVLKEELVSRMQFPFTSHGECPPWLGMYGFGEFAKLAGRNTYHNYTTALYAIYRK